MMFVGGVSPDDPFLFAINIAGKEIDDCDYSRFGNYRGMNECGLASSQSVPIRGDSLRQTDAQSARSRSLAQLLRVDFRRGHQPAAAAGNFRALGKRAQTRVG